MSNMGSIEIESLGFTNRTINTLRKYERKHEKICTIQDLFNLYCRTNGLIGIRQLGEVTRNEIISSLRTYLTGEDYMIDLIEKCRAEFSNGKHWLLEEIQGESNIINVLLSDNLPREAERRDEQTKRFVMKKIEKIKASDEFRKYLEMQSSQHDDLPETKPVNISQDELAVMSPEELIRIVLDNDYPTAVQHAAAVTCCLKQQRIIKQQRAKMEKASKLLNSGGEVQHE